MFERSILSFPGSAAPTLAALTLLFPAVLFANITQQPNVVIVFIDDMGWSDLSCFGGVTPTKNIHRLASEGLRFTNFYVNSPICSPSRVALTTGQYPQRWRISSYLDLRKRNEKRGMAQWLDPSAPSLPRQLQLAGYATGHFGKWHMGGQRDVDNAPPISLYGFDKSLTNFEGMGAKLLPLTMQPDWEEPGKIWDDAERLGEPVTWMQRSEITKGFVDAALKFIDQSQEERKPFYINLWSDDVHRPYFPPLDRWAGDKQGLYRSVLLTMDEQLGPLFNHIREDESLKANTLVLLCSDNGPQAGIGLSEPLRGAKTWLYEGGVRSPLIVWAPGLMEKDSIGTTNTDSTFSAIDLNRSLYTLTKTKLPEVDLDGEDLSETILGKSNDSRQKPIFWRRPPDRPGFAEGYEEDNPDLAARHGVWKFYVNYDGSDRQLYQLKKDPSEKNNLIDSMPLIANRLHEVLLAWNAHLPKDAGDPTYNDKATLQ